MEKGGGSNSLLGWLGLLGLLVAVAVAAALGYLETARRFDMNEMSERIQYLENKIIRLNNMTEHLQQQLQAQEKKLEDDKSTQYYDDNSDYYDEDNYDEYRDNDDQDATVQDSSANKNRTRRDLAQDHYYSGLARMRRAVGGGSSDRYNLIISQGPRKLSSNRDSDVKAYVVIDKNKSHRNPKEQIQHPSAYRPYLPSSFDTSTRRSKILPYGRPTPSYQEQVFSEDRVRHNGKSGRKGDFVDDNGCCTSIAVQFGSDTSKYSLGRDPHFTGSHRMYHPEGLFKDWIPYVWGIDYDSHFSMDGGHLTVVTPGLYYVYAQIFYSDSHDTSGYKIYVNGVAQLQCTVTTLSNLDKMKRNSCYTGGLVRLQPNDKLTLREVEGHRFTLFEPTRSFFGLYRIANI